ncbi:SMP-30/gluconolactonase/LRE family protein [Nocardioides massiliensis]|uniref:Sugar lactone lactonase YvrE n=1 Tax=Nocardioides massiliensis TaxID=1325935 RepID=A0ABT9NKX6_9ACTN|nr:SMP-30/gluconolactonase/LRE family protein [Nocardioides massiliensis]MDP9821081.1 sugar lactone lactonase YvrE [Nocardioides massiliensis]
MDTADPTVVSTGYAFPECPRWHDGALWFSDIHAGQVVRLDIHTGSSEVVAEYDGHPSGLGFLPDGRLLVADGHTSRVLRREPDGTLVEHADVSSVATHTLNDMVVDAQGRAYVGNYGDASVPPAPPFPAALALVQPDGTVTAAATDMMFANGMVVTDEGRTLVVAETRSVPGRLTAFTIGDDGALSERRTLVEFDEGIMPDGIALAGDGSIWVASPFTNEVLHVSADGADVRSVPVPTPYAVAVGGDDLDVLLVCSAPTWVPEETLAQRAGAILRVDPRG